jgi:hypothetical protein
MARTLIVFLLAAVAALGAEFRLYLRDGNFHMVREYQVEGDRVRFYSVERSEWEEVPANLVDLKRTESERRERQEAIKKEAAEIAAEDKFEREQEDERARIPVEAGVYFVEGKEVKTLKQAESKAVNKKSRSILKRLAPIPVVSGKTTVEVAGEHSASVMTSSRPEFYMRLDHDENFGIVRMTAKKGVRVVQEWEVVPVTNEIIEKEQDIPVFRKQVDDGLYKIWPQQPLEPGEYALIEFTAGERNIQTWDFGCQPAPAGAHPM